MEIGTLIRTARQSRGLTLKTVEEQTGIRVTTQNNIELSQVKDPGFMTICKLANFYELPLTKIYDYSCGTGGFVSPKLALAQMTEPNPIRVLTLDQAKNHNDLNHGEDFDVISSPKDVDPCCFAVRVIGDSMQNDSNESLSDEDIVIIHPEMTPQKGDLVLVLLEDGHAAIRKLTLDGSKTVLLAANRQYPAFELTQSIRIIGVLITKIRDLV